MMGFFEFLANNSIVIVLFLVGGMIVGLLHGVGEPWKEKMAGAAVGAVIWGLILAPLLVRMDYSDYKRHYATCQKYEAKQAGYIMSGERCYKPVNKNTYIKVNTDTKTKQELLNDK